MKRIAVFFLLIVLAVSAAAGKDRVAVEGKAWLGQRTEAPTVNVDGKWTGKEWGVVTLQQAQGSRDVTGKGDGWTINGVVAGNRVFLLFSNRGTVNYSAELTAEGNTLKGNYSRSFLSENSKKKPMLLTK